MLVEELRPTIGNRAANALHRAGFIDVEQVRKASNHDLLRVPNFGATCLLRVRVAIDPDYQSTCAARDLAARHAKATAASVRQRHAAKSSETYAATIEAWRRLAQKHKAEFAVLYAQVIRERGLVVDQ